MYEIILTRLHTLKEVKKNDKLESGILGSFEVFKKDDRETPLFSCFSLENSGEPTDTPNLDRPIVARSYTLSWTDTSCTVPKDYQNKHNNRHACLQLHNPNDKAFSERKILIHVGNSAHDTLGCVLLGKQYDENTGMIYKSADAIKGFFDLVQELGVQNFELIIKDMQD
ncbi:DUF5675 family protein [Helicobacter cetorum]|uniref:DUF5675 domain-containing protein n=1 Tax=Helicobacter cetorum (strain ATCC BAA-429 / MIT 00-7128) TaxID=182217 RepID=I0ELP3_HELC0|nr:DUF5675 family protein [Helicobacter cetorum]AFI03862.1 hypothetical protein HCW_02905 [Helicobacter cetorum MIT 00-7128]